MSRVSILIIFTAWVSWNMSACDMKFLPETLVNLKAGRGLNQNGINKILTESEKIKRRVSLFNREILELPMIHHALMVSRIMNGNIFLYGPTGGAKTKLVDWFMSGEKGKTFQLQMHEMIGENDLIGSTSLENAEKGLNTKNTEGRLLEAVIALIDEAEKGSPLAYASLFNILSARKALLGNDIVKSRLKTLALTSNANLSEFKETFILNGQPTTADALLNRFHFKAFVYNWLSRENMVKLLRAENKKTRAKAIAQNDKTRDLESIFEKPEIVDWKSLENLSENIFEFSDDFEIHLVNFLEDMRVKNNEARILSEVQVQENQGNFSDIYHPSGDLSIRLALEIQRIIKASAFIDFLSSPLSKNSKVLEFLKTSRFKLDYLSIWRTYLNQTAISPGETSLAFVDDDLGLGVDFSWSVDISRARSLREKKLIENVKSEQMRFQLAFKSFLLQIKEGLKISGENLLYKNQNLRVGNMGEQSFEILLLNSKEKN